MRTRWLLTLVLVMPALAACGSEPVAPPVEPVWRVGSDMPTPRTEVAVAATSDGLIHVLGGFEADGDTSRAHETYDPSKDLWVVSEPLPFPLHHAMAVGAGDRLLVFGGYRAVGSASGRVLEWDSDEGWLKLDDMPFGLAAGAAVLSGQTVHLIGGATTPEAADSDYTPQVSDAHLRYEFGSGEWSQAPSVPLGRDHLTGAAWQGKVAVFGGRSLTLESSTGRVDVFDPESGTWTRLPDLPAVFGGGTATAAGGAVYVTGGEVEGGTLGDLLRIASDGSSESVETLPTPRHGLGSAVVAGRVWFIGGGREPGLSVTGATEGFLVTRNG